MFKSLLDSLNVRPEERLQVMLMLGAGFFMGIFFATYSVVAESLFLNNLGGELNKAFLVSGCLGIVATVLFSTVQNWIKFSNLTTASILFVVGITAFFYVGYNFGPTDYQKPIIFFMFCMTGPITAVLLLSYWGVFGRLFNFKQSKRIIGWIDTGQLIAVILANILIPLTASFFPATDSYLIVCILAILASAVHFIVISFRFPLIKNDPKEFDVSDRKETSMVKVLTDPYTKLLSLFLIISMVTLILGQFTFQELIKVRYPDQRDLTNFLAYFNGAIYALCFIMQTFVNDKLVSNYGIRIALMVLPIVVGIFALSASITGLAFGYTPEITFFFVFVALIRLFNNMIRDSLETPMFKLLFIPIDSRFRFGIQSKVEGVVNETGRATAGLLIFLFAMLVSFKIVWMPIILSVLIGLYFILIKKLYAGYKAKIRSKLETAETTTEKLEVGYGQITQKLEDRLASDKPGLAVFSSKLLEKINPMNMTTWINTLIRNGQEETRDYAQRKMNEMKGLSVSDKYVIRYDKTKSDVSDKNLLTKGELQMIINAGGDITKSRILRLTRSHEAGDRQYAAELLLHASSDENTSFLIELLNDPEPKVRNTAIKTSIKKNSPEVVLALIENLSNPQFSNQSMSALVQIGGRALSQLDSSFYRSGQSTQILIRIVQIIGRIGGQRAKDLLWNKIDYPDKVVVSKVLLGMGEAGFKAGISQISRIKFAIESDIGDVTWNLSAIVDLGNSNDGFARELKKAVRAEILNDIDHVYMLMAMLYDTRSIQLVKENIEAGTVEGTAFAIELLDVFLSDQLKERVIPVLDELSDHDRIKKLEEFYPRIELDERLVLKFLINRDFVQTNRWTKACVLRQIGMFKIREFTLDLIAQLFNPDRLIREMAAWALHEIDPQLYETNASRLGYEIHRDLDKVIKGNREKIMLFDEILFLGSVEVFTGISGLSLSFLADIAETVILEDKDSLSLDEKTNNNFYIVYLGEVDYYHLGIQKGVFRQGQFIGEMLSRPGFAKSNTLLAKEKTILMRINKDLLYELLAENVKLADRILDYV